MFLHMLKDDFPDVRLHIISKLELVNQGMHTVIDLSGLTRDGADVGSNWHRTTLAVPSSGNRSTGRGQAMACPVGHHQVHSAAR